MKKNIRELNLINLTSEYNQPEFRAKQLYRWLWKKSVKDFRSGPIRRFAYYLLDRAISSIKTHTN